MKTFQQFKYALVALLFLLPTVFAQPTTPSPADAATGVSTTPTLGWVGGSAPYSLEVATTSGFGGTVVTSATGIAGTSYTIPTALANHTVYYWHVQGATLGWSATFTFTTIASAAPAAFTLSSPANGVGSVGVSPSTTFSWNASTEVDLYTLEVSSDNFLTVPFGGTSTSTSQSISGLAYSTVYKWRVKAANDFGGGATTTSAEWSFTTGPQLPPVLTAPANAAIGVGTTPAPFSWSGGTPNYNLYVASDIGFTTIVGQVLATPLTSITPWPAAALTNNTMYYWKVTDAGPGPFEVDSFYTGDLKATVPSPPDANPNTPVSLTLSWAAVPNAASYFIEISTSPAFTSASTYTTSSTSQAVTGLSGGTLYYWRVTTTATFGSSGVSNSWTFTTAIAPGPPTLSIPTEGNTNVKLRPTFVWTPTGAAADSFRIQITPDPTFYYVPYLFTTTSSNYTFLTDLSTAAPYYWRVKAYNAGGSAVSSIDTFRVSVNGDSLPTVPRPSFPIDSITVYTYSPVLRWYSIYPEVGLTSEVEINTSGSFTGTPTTTGITGDTLPYVAAQNTLYYWKVRAKRGVLYSAWSDSVKFRTMDSPAASLPVLSWPIDNTTIYQSPAVLNWYVNAASAGLLYDVEIRTTAPLTGTPTDALLASTSLSKPVVDGQTYYWSVRSYNGVVPSAWAATDTFIVAVPVAAPILAPTLSWPISGASVYQFPVTLYWHVNGPTTGFTYSVEVGTHSGLAGASVFSTGSVDTLAYVAPSNGTYYWRVTASNGVGTAQSSIESFVVNVPSNALAVPVPAWPIGGNTVWTNTPDLIWYFNAYNPATSYDVEYGTSLSFGSTGTNDSTHFHMPTLSSGQTYYWHVRARNVTDSSAWSTTASFAVWDSIVPFTNVIGSPLPGVTLMTDSPTLSWYSQAQSTGTSSVIEVSDQPTVTNATVYQSTANHYDLKNLATNKTYYWRVRSKDDKGNYSSYSPTANFSIAKVTDIKNDLNSIPATYTLSQNYPNPFNPTTIIRYGIPQNADVTLSIYNMLGQKIKTLVSEQKNAGTYSVQWNGDNEFGQKVSSGAYIYRINAGNFVKAMKLILMK